MFGESFGGQTSYSAALERPEHLLAIGETTEYRVGIRAHHHRFRTGSRVRLRLSGGPPSKLTPPAAPVTVTMETGATAVLGLPGFTDPG